MKNVNILLMIKLKIKILNNDAKIPTYAHVGDAGMDLFTSRDVLIQAGKIEKISTGIAIEIPDGYVGLIWDKSGLAMNAGLKTLGGVVDRGYRGEVIVGIVNVSDEDFVLKKGDKVAQMLIQKIENVEIEEVSELDDTSRGEGGFGSTGK
jgi:dUTP pyrophosphatase